MTDDSPWPIVVVCSIIALAILISQAMDSMTALANAGRESCEKAGGAWIGYGQRPCKWRCE